MWKRSKLKHKVQKQNQTKNTQSTPTQNAIQIERNTNTRKKKQQKRRKKTISPDSKTPPHSQQHSSRRIRRLRRKD
jgi:hypothetical protein